MASQPVHRYGLPDQTTRMPTLVLLRHGQSTWNAENRFTGWTDVELTEQGIAEAHRAGRLLREQGIVVGAAYTSLLKRAITTLWIVLTELDCVWIPVHNTWLLAEHSDRHSAGV